MEKSALWQRINHTNKHGERSEISKRNEMKWTKWKFNNQNRSHHCRRLYPLKSTTPTWRVLFCWTHRHRDADYNHGYPMMPNAMNVLPLDTDHDLGHDRLALVLALVLVHVHVHAPWIRGRRLADGEYALWVALMHLNGHDYPKYHHHLNRIERQAHVHAHGYVLVLIAHDRAVLVGGCDDRTVLHFGKLKHKIFISFIGIIGHSSELYSRKHTDSKTTKEEHSSNSNPKLNLCKTIEFYKRRGTELGNLLLIRDFWDWFILLSVHYKSILYYNQAYLSAIKVSESNEPALV